VPKADAARRGGERVQHTTVRETPSAKGQSAPSSSGSNSETKVREAQELKKKRRKNAVVEVMLADLSNDRRHEDD
jgi:hypothetical protein